MITIALSGADKADARWADFLARLQQGLAQAMSDVADNLLARVAEKLGGGVMQRRSGRLAAAVEAEVAIAPNAVSVSVGFDRQQAPYGAIQEYGGTTRAHIIAVKSARALAFTVGDRLAFAKTVHHPGSVIPARSFLRASLADMAGEGRDVLALSVGSALDA